MPRYDAQRNCYIAGPGGDVGVQVYPTNGAITPADGTHALTKTSAGAYTLAPPSAGSDGMVARLVARTAFAHTVTITEGLGGRGGAFVKLTFANVGDCIELLADNLHWVAAGSPSGVVVSA